MTNVRGEIREKALKTTIFLVSIAILVSFIVSTSIKAFADDAGNTSGSDLVALEAVNEIRSNQGLHSLGWSNKLSVVATIKANDIINRGYFDHTNPDGEMIWSELSKNGYNYATAGENLAIDFGNIDEAYDAWVKSPSHLENIISKKFTDFGFGVATGNFEGKITNVYVQIFASPETIYEQIITNIGGNNG